MGEPVLFPGINSSFLLHESAAGGVVQSHYRLILTWLVSVSQFQGVKKVEELPDGDFESFKEAHFQEDTITRLERREKTKLGTRKSSCLH